MDTTVDVSTLMNKRRDKTCTSMSLMLAQVRQKLLDEWWTVETILRSSILWHLFGVYIVCSSLSVWTLGVNACPLSSKSSFKSLSSTAQSTLLWPCPASPKYCSNEWQRHCWHSQGQDSAVCNIWGFHKSVFKQYLLHYLGLFQELWWNIGQLLYVLSLLSVLIPSLNSL